MTPAMSAMLLPSCRSILIVASFSRDCGDPEANASGGMVLEVTISPSGAFMYGVAVVTTTTRGGACRRSALPEGQSLHRHGMDQTSLDTTARRFPACHKHRRHSVFSDPRDESYGRRWPYTKRSRQVAHRFPPCCPPWPHIPTPLPSASEPSRRFASRLLFPRRIAHPSN